VTKVDEAIEILRALGLPDRQQNERSALTLLALAKLGRRDPWSAATQPLLRIWDIMGFMEEAYAKRYAANSRETIRRQTIHQFEQAHVCERNPDDPTRPTNSGKTVYRLTDEAASVVRLYGSDKFDSAVSDFISKLGSLKATYRRERRRRGVPLQLPDGSTVLLSPGKHNELQVSVIEEMGPRFAPGARVLYVGDTAKKHVVLDAPRLTKLGINITEHDKLPDVVLYQQRRRWLFLVEAVTSHGPVSPKRHAEIEKMMRNCCVDRVYVSAFQTSADFRRFAGEIAWETEVWIAEHPSHMIHFNGPKFLGPHKGSH